MVHRERIELLVHDVRSAIAPIFGFCELLGPQSPLTDQIAASAKRACGLLEDFQTKVPRLALADVQAIVEGLKPSFEVLLGPSRSLRLIFEEKLPPLMLCRSGLERALTNLVSNAAEAEGTTQVTVEIKSAPAASVTISVIDNGCGIPHDLLPSLGRRRVSVKVQTSPLRGLGLLSVQQFAENSGGGFTIESKPGSTRATISLKSREMGVLLVEDEETLSEVLCLALQKEGYTVHQAHDAKECFDILRRQAGKISVILLDAGLELLERLEQSYPGKALVLISGKPLAQGQKRPFLLKPFTTQALIDAMHEAYQHAETGGGISQERILVVEAPYYEDVAPLLRQGATRVLEAAGVAYDVVTVPGALEIPTAIAAALKKQRGHYTGFVALGCVIRGQTEHFAIVARESTHHVTALSVQHAVPIGNGILATYSKQHALERADPERRDSGGAAARACLSMLEIGTKS